MAHLPDPDCVATYGQRDQWAAIYDALYELNQDSHGPVLLSATIAADGETLTLVFDEPVTGNAGFTLNPNGGAATLVYNSGDGTDTLVFDISRVVYSFETVTLDYAPGDVEDLAGNPLAAFSGTSVTNNSAQVFDPDTIANLQVWHDASDLATITKDGANRVSAWADKSGNARTISQGTAANQPLWVDAVYNGLATIRFDGVSDVMSRALFQNATTYTIFVLAKSSNAAQNGVLVYNGNSGSNGYGLMQLPSSGARSILHGGVANINDGAPTTNLESWISVNSPGTTLFYLNGTSQALVGSGNPNVPTGSYSVGASSTVRFPGDICEVGMYSAALTPAQVTLLNAYLIDKWG